MNTNSPEAEKLRKEGFRLGYMKAIGDYSDFMQSLPQRHGGDILFQKDVFADECNQFISDANIRADLRAEQMIHELMEMELTESRRDLFIKKKKS